MLIDLDTSHLSAEEHQIVRASNDSLTSIASQCHMAVAIWLPLTLKFGRSFVNNMELVNNICLNELKNLNVLHKVSIPDKNSTTNRLQANHANTNETQVKIS